MRASSTGWGGTSGASRPQRSPGSHLGGSHLGGPSRGLPFAPPLSLRPRLEGGVGRAPWRVGRVPGPPHLDHITWMVAPDCTPPGGRGCRVCTEIRGESGGSGPPQDTVEPAPGRRPLQTTRLGAQGVGGKPAPLGRLCLWPGGKVIPLCSQRYFDGVR